MYYCIGHFSRKLGQRFSCFSRFLCNRSFDNGFGGVEGPLDYESFLYDKGGPINTAGMDDDDPDGNSQGSYLSRWSFIQSSRVDADRAFRVLQQDGPGFDTKLALTELQIRVSGLLVRGVLLSVLKTMNRTNRSRCARLGFKFFHWSGQQDNYRHTTNTYHMIMKIFSEAEEFKAMWRLADEMIEKGFPITACTFTILISTCGEAGLAKKVVEKFIKSKTFSFRPFKHCYNAILHSLVVMNQYGLIEWVYQKMLDEGYPPDVLTYNILMRAKFNLGKLDHFHSLLEEMGRNGFSPDFHTFSMILYVLGKGDKPLAALNLLNHMREVGPDPTALHFTTLIDGLSRAGNLDACKYFFDEMIRNGCFPDVVCYTVMITSYVAAGELEKAQRLFDEMIMKGQFPNVFTYNAMIRGLCMAGKFDEACSMLHEMVSRGCNPNFVVYSTLVSYLKNAGKLSEANSVIKHLVENGKYIHLLSRIENYRRC